MYAIDPQWLKRIDELLCTGQLLRAVVLLRREAGSDRRPGSTRRKTCWSNGAPNWTGWVS